ncbi:MAG: AAA-like domain-containing protein [Microcoleaceae cyanobacterium]
MNAQEALDFVDRLVYQRQQKHLSDLEREVFIGSWQGKTYTEISPQNAQYIERNIAFKMWRKISDALGEKVTKKTIKGAVERSIQPDSPCHNVLINYHHHEPDCHLVQQFQEAITLAGHQVEIVTLGGVLSSSSTLNTAELGQIDRELERCNYFILLLSPQAAMSEILIEQLKKAKERENYILNSPPIILPIRVNCPATLPLNHDLRNYLLGTCQREWKSAADTPIIIQEILNFLSNNVEWNSQHDVIPGWEEWKTVGIEEWEREINTAFHQVDTPLVPVNIPSPLPVAEPELPRGQVRLESAFYIRRNPYESQCYQEILYPGALVRLKAPRQMGKTSLMARILDYAREQGYRTVPLSFQHADKGVFANLNLLLRWFCARVARKLRLPYVVEDYWTETFGSKDNCTAFFEDCLLSETDTPLVLGLDEVDRVFQYPKIADDFFSLLRAWYEEAGYGDPDSELWQKLRLVIVHSTEVYIPLDINQSPFNVGLPIHLPEFTPEQVYDLAQRHGLNLTAVEIQDLMKLVGGHPYLIRLAFYHIVRQQLTLSQLLETAATESGIYSDHLRRHLWNLQQHPDLAAAFYQVLTQQTPIELKPVLAFKLHSMGLVNLQADQVTPCFELYRDYFYHRLTASAS